MLCVYDKHTPQNGFNSFGLGVLKPLLFKTKEILNNDYSVSIQYPISNEDSMWMYLTPYNIVKNSEDQLFYIHTCGSSYINGKAVWNAQARHISYYLSDKLVRNCKYDNVNCDEAMYWIIMNTQLESELSNPSSYTEYGFTLSSDITDIRKNIDYNNISTTNALLGASNSIVNLYGAEISRDNFRIRANRRKYGTRDNAFELKHGLNMLEIHENININNLCTTFYGEDNFGGIASRGYVSSNDSPHQILKYAKFSYDSGSNLTEDVKGYFEDHMYPEITYSVKFKDLKNIDKYAKWRNLQTYNVGDSGMILSDLLHINTNQKIISRTLNDITGETEEITLGNLMPSLFTVNKYSMLISRNDAVGKRLSAIENLRLHTLFVNVPD